MSPELQHRFCVLWNEVVLKAQKNNNGSIPEYIFIRIRNIYIALHQNTDAVPTRFSTSTNDNDSILWLPSSYPVCNIPDHHPGLTTHIHKDIVPTTFTRDLSPRALPTSAGSSSARNQVPADVRSKDVPPVDNNFSGVASGQRRQKVESLDCLIQHRLGCVPVTTIDAAAADVNNKDRFKCG